MSSVLPTRSPEALFNAAESLSEKFKHRASEADKAGALAKEDIHDLAESGILSMTIPQEDGGWGATLHDTLKVQLELAKGSASTALVIAMTTHQIARERVIKAWQKPLREKLFQAVLDGKLVNSAASEPRLGSPSRGGLPDTYAEQKDDHYLISGHKNWVTGGEHLAYLLVRLRLDDSAVTMLVPNQIKGIRWEKTWGDSLSLRASDSHDLHFDSVSVPLENKFASVKTPALVWFPMLMAATYFGVALAARDDIIKYALERVPTALGKPIATLPKIQRQIGELDIQLQAAKSFLLTTAAKWQDIESERQAYLAEVAAAKHFAIETALQVTDKVLRIAGGAAIDKSLPFERYFRDVRAGIMHPPSGDTALEAVGRARLDVN